MKKNLRKHIFANGFYSRHFLMSVNCNLRTTITNCSIPDRKQKLQSIWVQRKKLKISKDKERIAFI